MNFELTAEQALLQNAARTILAERSSFESVRRWERDAGGYDRNLWEEVAGLGWHGLSLPERFGGSGLGALEQVLLLREMGRTLWTSPYLAHVLASWAIAQFGSENLQRRVLPVLASGEDTITTAIFGLGVDLSAAADAVVAEAGSPHSSLDGNSLFVPYVEAASWILVLGTQSGEPELFLVRAQQAGVNWSLMPGLSGDRQYRVDFQGAIAEPLAGGDSGGIAEFLWSRGALLATAYMTGAGEALVEMTAEYAKQRTQFGVPIGSFQAVQHRCADMKVDVDAAVWLTLEAAWRLDQAQGVRDVSVAKAYASDALRRAVTHGHQVHGAIGFSEEHPMPLFTRRVKALEVLFGDATLHREWVAQALLDGEPA